MVVVFGGLKKVYSLGSLLEYVTGEWCLFATELNCLEDLCIRICI